MDRTVNVFVPAVGADTAISPPDARVPPAGRAPLSRTYEFPLVAISCTENGVPAAAFPSDAAVTHAGLAAISCMNVLSTYIDVDRDSARTVNVYVPACVGVPEMRPPVDIVTPAGSDPDTMANAST